MLQTQAKISRKANACLSVQDAVPEEHLQEDMMKDIGKGNFTMRILYEQLANIQKMGPVNQVMSMIPGLANSGIFTQVRDSFYVVACTCIISMLLTRLLLEDVMTPERVAGQKAFDARVKLGFAFCNSSYAWRLYDTAIGRYVSVVCKNLPAGRKAASQGYATDVVRAGLLPLWLTLLHILQYSIHRQVAIRHMGDLCLFS